MTTILGFIFSIILFPFKAAWYVITWPFKTMWHFLDGSYNESKPVKIVDFDEVPKKEVPRPSNVNTLTLDEEIEEWYISRRDGKDVVCRDIHEVLADLLPEGRINPSDWREETPRRSGGLNHNPYKGFKTHKYSKHKPHEFGILEYSEFNGKMVHNPRAKLFKVKPTEKVLNFDPASDEEIKQIEEKKKKDQKGDDANFGF